MEIPLFLPSITDDEINEVTQVLKYGWLSQGKELKKFEGEIAKRCDRKYAIAVNSGTSALHIALMSLGIGEGDEVITTSYSFIATANSILFVGAKPVFVDIDPISCNLDPKLIKNAITEKTKAIIAVEVLGNFSHFEEYEKIAEENGVYLIEDSCEALGAIKNGRKAGNFGVCSIFGFFPNKQITSGEGGMLLTDDERIRDVALSLRNHGKDSSGVNFIRLGYNFKMSELTAALGYAQIKRLDELLAKRARVAQIYNKLMSDIEGICLPNYGEEDRFSWFMYVIRLSNNFKKEQRDRLIEMMNLRGISCTNAFTPIHLQEHYNYEIGDYPQCEYVCDRTVMLPFYCDLEEYQINIIVNAFKECISKISC